MNSSERSLLLYLAGEVLDFLPWSGGGGNRQNLYRRLLAAEREAKAANRLEQLRGDKYVV